MVQLSLWARPGQSRVPVGPTGQLWGAPHVMELFDVGTRVVVHILRFRALFDRLQAWRDGVQDRLEDHGELNDASQGRFGMGLFGHHY